MELRAEWLPRALAALAFAFYALLAPPGMTWLDSSELGAAAFQLGAPHPTGFPLVVLLGKLTSLVPIGELAYRMHLLSAAAAALAVLWVVRLVATAVPGVAGEVGGVVGGLAVALALTFARQATVFEVYAPTAALIAATLLLFDRVARGGDARDGLVLALVVGLGFGVHASARMLLVAPLLLLLVVRLRRGARWPLMVPLVIAVIAGALSAALPVRSATGRTAEVDWGHPRELDALIAHATAQDVRSGFADQMMSDQPLVIRDHASRVATRVADDLGALALIAALAGAVWLLRERRSRWLLLALGAIVVGDLAYAVWINPMGIADRQNGVPLAVAIGVLAGTGVAWLGRFAGRAGPASAVAAGVMVLAAPAQVSWPTLVSGARADVARRHAEMALAETPPRGVLLARSDSMAANLTWLRVAERARPDVAPLVRQRLGDVERTAAILGAPVGPDPLASLLALGRPVAWELGDDAPPSGWAIEPRGAVGLLTRSAASTPGDIRRAMARVLSLASTDGDEPVAARTIAHALTSLGGLAYRRGDVDLALELFQRAVALRPQHVEALVNLGVALSAAGRLPEAIRATEAALALEPNRVRALVNAARYQAAVGDAAGARRHADRARRLAPRDPDVRRLP